MDWVKEKLIDIEGQYVEAISHFDSSWTSQARREVFIEKLMGFTKESQFASALTTMEEGFSWPISQAEQDKLDELDEKMKANPEADVEMENSVEKRRGMVRRFWSSDEAQEEWKEYVSQIGDDAI